MGAVHQAAENSSSAQTRIQDAGCSWIKVKQVPPHLVLAFQDRGVAL